MSRSNFCHRHIWCVLFFFFFFFFPVRSPVCDWSFCAGPNQLGVRLETIKHRADDAIKEKKNDTSQTHQTASMLSYPADLGIASNKLHFALLHLLLLLLLVRLYFVSIFDWKKREEEIQKYKTENSICIQFNIWFLFSSQSKNSTLSRIWFVFELRFFMNTVHLDQILLFGSIHYALWRWYVILLNINYYFRMSMPHIIFVLIFFRSKFGRIFWIWLFSPTLYLCMYVFLWSRIMRAKKNSYWSSFIHSIICFVNVCTSANEPTNKSNNQKENKE